MAALVATRFGRTLMLLLAASVLATAAAGIRATRDAARQPARTLTGSTAAGGRISLTLRGDEIASIRPTGLDAACRAGWTFRTPAEAPSLSGLHVQRDGAAFKATGSQQGRYPDGSLGWAAKASVTGTTGRSARGTVEETVTLYAEGSVTGRCSTGPASFTAR